MADVLGVIVNIACVIIAVISIVENALVCHVILRSKTMKTVMNYLLLNLAILDLMISILAVFKVIINDRPNVFGTSEVLEQVSNKSAVAAEVLCKIEALFWAGTTVTPVLLVAIAYERYMAVVHPLTTRLSGGYINARLKWIIPICWFCGLPFVVAEATTASYVESKCNYLNLNWFNRKIYVIFSQTLHFIIPAVVLFSLYSQVIKSLRTRKTLAIPAAAQQTRKKCRRKAVLVVLAITIIFYICCGIPHTVYFLRVVFSLPYWNTKGLPVLLFTLNSALNPLINFFFITSFRNKLKLICKISRKAPRQNVSIINANTPRLNIVNYSL
jgi:hypothetical protein